MKQLIVILVAVLLTNCSFAQKGKNAEKTSEQVKHLKLYPVEADKYVNIYVDFNMPKDFALTLLPTEFNNEKKWSLKAKETYQTSMDVTNLPDGKYTVVLVYEAGEEKETFDVKHK